MKSLILIAVAANSIWASKPCSSEPVVAASERHRVLSPRVRRPDLFIQLVIRLPRVDRATVETIRLQRPGDNTPFTPVSATLEGARAERLARIWRQMRQGTPVQCYSPAYRVTFFSRGKELVRADVCFDCNKIEIAQDNEYYDISGNLKARSALKRMFQSLTD
jgi:hypothetical protein